MVGIGTSLRGVLAPILTPFGPDLIPDPKRFTALARALLQLDLGVVPFGTTGEGNSLSVGERMILLDAMAEDKLDMSRVMAGTGCCALTDTVRLTAHAVALGCAGVLMLPPFYFKGVSDDGLFRAYAETIDRVGDGRLRVYLYHFPRHSQIPISPALVERLLKAYPATIAGIKDSSGDLANMEVMRRSFPGLDLFTGNETHMLTCLRMGGAGVIASNANINGTAMVDLYHHWGDTDADALQQMLVSFRVALQDFPQIAALKTLISEACGDPAWRIVRPPLLSLTPEQERNMFQRLSKAGFPV